MIAFRVLVLLALVCVVAGVVLFFLHAFSYVIALAIAVVFGLGALAALAVERSRSQLSILRRPGDPRST